MPAGTYYCRSAETHTGTNSVYNYDFEPTTTSPSVNNWGEGGNTPFETWYYTDTTEPNTLTWTGGTFTWYLNITTANSSLIFTAVKLKRVSTTFVEKANMTSIQNVTLSSTGMLSGTMDWNDGTQNPGGSLISDRFVLAFEFTRAAGAMSIQSSQHGVNLITDSRLDTPWGLRNLTQTMSDSLTFTESIQTEKAMPMTIPLTKLFATRFVRRT